MKATYPAVIHAEDDRYWVEFPDLDGCFSCGDTLDEAERNAKEALSAYLLSLAERGLAFPAPSVMREISIIAE